MRNQKNHKQGYLFDPWAHLGPKRRKLLEDSWAGLFREHVLTELPVDEIAPFFKDDFGRPTKELYMMMGAVLLQQVHDLTDEETVDQVAFSEQWRYALNITSDSDEAAYICPKTLYNMHRIFINNNIHESVFNKITDKLARAFDVDVTKQRIDSKHIKSDMARLGRIGLMVKTISKFLVNLKRQRRELFDGLPEELVKKYMSEKERSCFSMVKPSESANTLASVAQDLFELSMHFAGNEQVTAMTSFQLLLRVLHEQCKVTENDAGEPVEVEPRPCKDVPADSLQNPSDPEAGYDSHKGQGYQVQVMETYSDEEDPDKKAQELDLITYIEVEPACEHDSSALMPAIESTQERGLGPDEVLADSHYGGDENVAAAAEAEVELIAPAMGTKKKDKLGLDEFEFTEEGEVSKCPAGHAPVKNKTNKKKGRHSAAFNSDVCADCPHAAQCPAQRGKKHHYLRYSDKELRLARRRQEEKTPAFKDRYRRRSGVEATMSDFDRMTNIKRLRVRGRPAVCFCAFLKAAGVNIFRATKAKAARKAKNPAPPGPVAPFSRPFYAFKELVPSIIRESTNLLFPTTPQVIISPGK